MILNNSLNLILTNIYVICHSLDTYFCHSLAAQGYTVLPTCIDIGNDCFKIIFDYLTPMVIDSMVNYNPKLTQVELSNLTTINYQHYLTITN